MNILITDAHGALGRTFGACCDSRALPNTRKRMDLTDRSSIEALLDRFRPDACINAQARLSDDDGVYDRVTHWRENCVGPVRLAEACARRGIRLVTFSSDQVFDGRASEPYLESSPTSPRDARGRSLAAAEAAVLEANRGALVIRTAALLGPDGLVLRAVEQAGRGELVTVDDGHVLSPTYLPDLVNAVLDLLVGGATGLWHVTNDGAASWYDIARKACEIARLDPALVRARGKGAAPLSTALASGRGLRLPSLEDALMRHLEADGQRKTA